MSTRTRRDAFYAGLIDGATLGGRVPVWALALLLIVDVIGLLLLWVLP